MTLKEIIEKVRKNTSLLENHESRIGNLEKSFEFIKQVLLEIKNTMPVKFKLQKFTWKKALWLIGTLILLVGIFLG